MVTTYYLEMTAPPESPPMPLPPGVQVSPLTAADPARNRALYLAVGAPWGWTDKASWLPEQWARYVAGHGHQLAEQVVEQIHTWILTVDDKEAGYFELAQAGDAVELRYFGLLPHAIGQGLGAVLLSAAIAAAWSMRPARVWVHTCTLDHPAALTNYLKRGFRLYHTQTA